MRGMSHTTFRMLTTDTDYITALIHITTHIHTTMAVIIIVTTAIITILTVILIILIGGTATPITIIGDNYER